MFGLLALEQATISGREEIFTIVIATVLMSIFAHGPTAVQGARWYRTNGSDA